MVFNDWLFPSPGQAREAGPGQHGGGQGGGGLPRSRRQVAQGRGWAARACCRGRRAVERVRGGRQKPRRVRL